MKLFALGALVMIGASAHADMFKPSKGQQIKLGERASEELHKEQRVLPESDERVQTLRRVGHRLIDAMNAKDKDWPYTFDVIQSKEVNAFALPGGKVFFFTGLLDKLTTEDQLAGVLGHELTHVRREHWAYTYRDSQKRNIILTLGLIFSRASEGTADIAGISDTLLFDLPFSRKHESEADDGGFDDMTAAGYNPSGEADVFRLLQSLAGGGKDPEFFSDHPADKHRVIHIEDRIRSSNQTYPPQRPLPWIAIK
jgi:predicted Zn-dependent protease